MEIRFQNSKAVFVNFPVRKLRNKSKKNWDDSKEQRMFLEKQESHVDGSNSDVVIKYKTAPFLKEKLTKGKLSVNGVYSPDQTDPEIESLLEVQERVLLKGKTVREATVIELIQAGIIKL